jgi:predicted alpha-1,2-mannosidase
VESNPLQQGWFVPHDPNGLADLLGGPNSAAAKLNDMFEKTPTDFHWNDYYNHSNEPVHFAPFLFNAWGKPWLTQKWVHTILAGAYHDSVNGICGNDDVGQMSAWYVLAAMGLHPLCPGTGRYELCGPLFDRLVVRLDPKYAKGKTFTITADRAAPSEIYIQSVKLNGQPLNRTWITHSELTAGGRLEFKMGPKPNTRWAISKT